jgi:hypothetical protein
LQNFIIFFEPYGGCKQRKNTKKPQEKGGASSIYSAMAIGLKEKQTGWVNGAGLWVMEPKNGLKE